MEKLLRRELRNKEMLLKLGVRLRHFRKLRGYKTAGLAANKIEVQRSQYSRYEAGTTSISFLTLVDILDKMEIPISEFFSEGFD